MIITRTPFRVSFVGGGSDLPSFYTKHPGCVVSVSINRHIYVSVHKFFDGDQFHLKYSKVELANRVEEIQHPIVREAALVTGVRGGIELTSTADVPAGTGLGSSSSFAVGVLHALYAYQGIFVSKEKLASEASDIEISKLQEPIGKQDQYAAAFGGLSFIRFHSDGRVTVEPIVLDRATMQHLEQNFLMFYLGGTRSSGSILREQNGNMNNGGRFELVIRMTELAEHLRSLLWEKKYDEFGSILDKAWQLKRSIASCISNGRIDSIYDRAMKAGALGGKLLGAGGNGFMLLYCPSEKQKAVRSALPELKPFPFRFDMEGSRVIFVGEE
jgi:D-glycero-alpha-D-manno-heptose-7-phosphate kinase